MILTRSSNGAVVIELLPTSTDTSAGAPMPVLPFTEVNHPLQIDDARQRLVEHIQAHTGFDRVLYYLFRHDETGEVVAEACGTETTGTYHGLRFPASDIPRIARDLYMKSPWRTIPDAQAASINILGRGETPPDLSHADLRSVSPVHQSYMANMGVAGAVSIPVKTATRLKALISCHSAAPRNLTLPELKALADQVFTFNLRLRELLTSRRMSLLDRMEKRFQSWHNQVVQAGSLDDAWPELAQQLCEEFQADGVWLDVENRAYQFGTVPDTEAMELIEDWLSTRQDPNDIVLSQGVTHDCPHPLLTEAAGLAGLSVQLRNATAIRCYFFRQEEVQQVAWGGNPNKPTEQQAGSLAITPRRSFERWVETRLGYCQEWSEDTRIKLLNLRGFLIGLVP